MQSLQKWEEVGGRKSISEQLSWAGRSERTNRKAAIVIPRLRETAVSTSFTIFMVFSRNQKTTISLLILYQNRYFG